MVAVFSCIILLAGYFIYATYNNHIQNARDIMLAELVALTKSLSIEIDAEQHTLVVDQYLGKDDIKSAGQDSNYYAIHKLLAAHASLQTLKSPIYTLVFDSTSQMFQFIVTSSTEPYYRHDYKDFPEQLLKNYSTGGKVADYKTENGRWLSAFMPVKDNMGNIVAIVQTDHEFDSFITAARKKLQNHIFIALAIVIGLSIILFRFMHLVLGREMKIKKILQNKNREIIGQNEEIRAQHEEIIAQNEKISENNAALEKTKRLVEEKNLLLKDANKLLDDKVKQRTQALQESMENLDNFLYRSYHDILGPIATIKGLCELSKLDIKDNNALTYINKIDNSVDNLKQSTRKVNAVYELKNRHFTTEKINVKALITKIIEKQQYLFQLNKVPLNNLIKPGEEINTDLFFLDLLLNDIIRNIISYSSRNEIDPISFASSKKDRRGLSLLIHDPGNHEIFLKSYFQFHQNQAISVNHDLYIFHSALNKLKCKIINYDEGHAGQTMELIIPNKITD